MWVQEAPVYMDSNRLLLNVKEVGRALGISVWTIRRYVREGKLATVRLGRRVLIEPSECHRLIEEGRVAPLAGDSAATKPSKPARLQTAEPASIEA
jgi:excisionase family DNA binding protein